MSTPHPGRVGDYAEPPYPTPAASGSPALCDAAGAQSRATPAPPLGAGRIAKGEPDWPALIARVQAGERATHVAWQALVSVYALTARVRYADPEYVKRWRKAQARGTADARAAGKYRNYNGNLKRLTPEERADYDTLRRKGHYTREEALRAIKRGDLCQ